MYLNWIQDIDFCEGINVSLTITDLAQYQVWIINIKSCDTNFTTCLTTSFCQSCNKNSK